MRIAGRRQILGVRLIGTILQSARLAVGGFITAHVSGRTQGRNQLFQVEAIYDEGWQYWANGLIPTVAARMVAQNQQFQKGVHYLANAVEPIAFVTELRKFRLAETETFGTAPGEEPKREAGQQAQAGTSGLSQ